MDHELELCYQENLKDLDLLHAKSPAVALALDDTDFQAHPKDMNGAYGYVQIGQQMLWKRGLIFPAFYDLTHMELPVATNRIIGIPSRKINQCSH